MAREELLIKYNNLIDKYYTKKNKLEEYIIRYYNCESSSNPKKVEKLISDGIDYLNKLKEEADNTLRLYQEENEKIYSSNKELTNREIELNNLKEEVMKKKLTFSSSVNKALDINISYDSRGEK